MAIPSPGTPIWCDLSTPDVNGALTFYGTVLGWTFAAPPTQSRGWTAAQTTDGTVAGIGPMMGDYPPSWTVYLASADTDTDIARVIELGGALFGGPMDIGAPESPMGRMAIVGDPAGAVFGLWQPGSHIGFPGGHAPGRPVWFELIAVEMQVAAPFYRELYGWSERSVDEHVSVMVSGEGDRVGMRRPSTEDLAAGLPPALWLPYFHVPDTDSAVIAAGDCGGRAVSGPRESGYGRTAVVADPYGAQFALVGPHPIVEPEGG